MLEGDTELLDKLHRQLLPPFCLWIERRHPHTKPKIYSTPLNEYAIDVVFEGKLQEEFSAGNDLSFIIDDLTIVEANLNKELKVVGTINNGILTNIRFISDEPVKWPKYITLKDWNFWLGDQPTKKRQSFAELDIALQKIQIPELKDSWVKTLFTKADKGRVQIGLWTPAEEAAISNLELEHGLKLPTDFKEFLRTTNGATISGVKLFGCDDVYPLEMNNPHFNPLTIIMVTIAGNIIALDLSRIETVSSVCPVIFFDQQNDEFITLAENFKEWLTKLVDEAIGS